MKFRATGRDRATGEPLEMTFEAANAQAALIAAERRGIAVDAVNPVTVESHVQPPPMPQYSSPQRSPALATSNHIRGWAVLLVIGSLVASVFSPPAGFAFAGLLIVLIAFYFIPGVSVIARPLLGLSKGRPVATAFRLVFVLLLALLISIIASTASTIREAAQKEEERKAAEITRRQQVEAQANATVDTFMVDVRAQLEARNVAAAAMQVSKALATPHATNKTEAQQLSNTFALSMDSARVKTLLVDMSDEEYQLFASAQKVPPALDAGYPVLTDAIVALAKPMVKSVGVERAALATRRAEEERRRDEELAAEVTRRHQAAEATRKAEAARVAAERSKYEKKTGETLHVGYTAYCAWSATWSDQLSDNQFLNKRANASWLIVNMTIRNDDKKARTIPPIKLVDEAGREYDASTDGMMTENAIGILEDLNPDVSKQGNVIFDVPKGRKYKLKLSGGYWSSDNGFIVLNIK